MNSVLYNRESPLLDLTIEHGHIIEIGKVRNFDLLPIIVHRPIAARDGSPEKERAAINALSTWFAKRTIPAAREGMREARLYFQNFEAIRTGASLSDQYWVRFRRQDRWSTVNFFTNTYTEAVGDVQFLPWAVKKEDLEKPSPDRTTNGLARKQWIQDPSTMVSYLYKSGSAKHRHEPLSECLSSLVMQKFRLLPYVKYDLCIHHLVMCSKCRNFVTENTEFVPAKHLYSDVPFQKGEGKFDHLVRAAELYGVATPEKYLYHLILADLLIGNSDRHLGNFGFIRDVHTGKITGFAPVFDFGDGFPVKPRDDATRATFFDEKRSYVLQHYASQVPADVFRLKESLYLIIDRYPDLTDREKQSVKEGIEEREKIFLKPGKVRGAMCR